MSETAPKPPLAVLIAIFTPPTASIVIFLPSMPGLQAALGTDYASVQLTLSLYLVGLGITQLLYGPISDRFGRRPVLLAGYAIFIIGTFICMAAPTIAVLVVGRVIQALGVCAGLVLARAIVRDLYEREQAASALAYMTTAMTVTLMIAPTVGGFLDTRFGWRAVFAFLLAVGIGVWVSIALFLRETHQPESSRSGFGDYLPALGYLFRTRAFWGYAICLSAVYATYSAFFGGAPYVVIRLMALSPEAFGVYMGSLSLAYAAGNFIAGRISVKVGVDRMIAWGSAAGLACSAILALVSASGELTPLTMFVPVFALWVTQGLVVPTGMAGSVSVNPRMAGAAAGITGFMQMAAGAAATYLVGALLADSAAPVVLTIVSGCAIAWLAHGLGVRWFPRKVG
ncbi:MAG: Bcr/CflA family efflux MFS transporter [Rhodospirillales bacterium]|nr:Bcr/CflA family efflux MFS transporter [Rhodospirillales bacterium]